MLLQNFAGAKIHHAVHITTLNKELSTKIYVTHKSTGQPFALHQWLAHIKDQEFLEITGFVLQLKHLSLTFYTSPRFNSCRQSHVYRENRQC